MCGICGVVKFNINHGPIEPRHLQKMCDALKHRGPDDGRVWISSDQKVGFGFRRLAIIDLTSNAMQPMCNEDGSVWVVFNGEIYNHEEIRKELNRVGSHRWLTDHSDTEVIVHAFEQWGIACLEKFRGMFAIGIWDARKHELWLIRDRIGIKPLYYSISQNQIIFASEIKAILQIDQRNREVNEEALYHYLSFLTTPSPDTLFKNIKKLTNGCWLKINESGDVVESRYWDVWDHTKPSDNTSEADIEKELLAELRVAVKLRKISDVPVGVFLSGGIDSSTNTALFSEGEDHPVKTFTIGYEGTNKSYQNEFKYARQMADLVKSDHHELLLSQDDLIEFLPKMIHLQDEPIGDPVCVPLYYVSKLARDNGVIVCQVGEGADELFGGYPSWITSIRCQNMVNFPVPFALKKLGMEGLKHLVDSDSFKYEWLRRGSENLPIFWGGAEAFTENHKKRLISPRLQKEFYNYTSWEAVLPIYERYMSKAWEKSPLHWMSYLDLNLRLPELLLMRVDKMSMGVSLECRVPFLDHKFVEKVMSIPSALKLKNLNRKYLLKKTVRGVIPDELIDRKKQGFSVPIHEWIVEKLGDYAKQEIEQFCKETDFFGPLEVRRIIDQKNSYKIWFLLNLALWWKQYIKVS